MDHGASTQLVRPAPAGYVPKIPAASESAFVGAMSADPGNLGPNARDTISS